MLFGWAFLSPLSKYAGWAPGPVSSSVDGARGSWLLRRQLAPLTLLVCTGWILWPALAIMMAESILSITMVALSSVWAPLKKKHLVKAVVQPYEEDDDDFDDDVEEVETEADEREADMRVVGGGVVLSCILCVALVGVVFGEEGIKWWATIIALVLASIFSILGYDAPYLSPPLRC